MKASLTPKNIFEGFPNFFLIFYRPRTSDLHCVPGVEADVQGAVAAVARLGGGGGGYGLTEVFHLLKPLVAAQPRPPEEPDSVADSEADADKNE